MYTKKIFGEKMVRISKNQKKILEILNIKQDMTTKEIAEMVFGKLIEYKTKEYSSIHRSLISLEREGLIKRVQVKLMWQLKKKPAKTD